MKYYSDYPEVEVPEFLEQILPDIADDYTYWHHEAFMHHLCNPSSYIELRSGFTLLVINGDEYEEERGHFFEISLPEVGLTIDAYGSEHARQFILNIAQWIETHGIEDLTDDNIFRKLCLAGVDLLAKYIQTNHMIGE